MLSHKIFTNTAIARNPQYLLSNKHKTRKTRKGKIERKKNKKQDKPNKVNENQQKKLKQPRNKTKKEIEKKGKYGILFSISPTLNNFFIPTLRLRIIIFMYYKLKQTVKKLVFNHIKKKIYVGADLPSPRVLCNFGSQ